GLFRHLDHEVDADHRNVDGARRLDGGFDQARMDAGGDVVDRAAGMQIGGLAHDDLLAGRGNRIERHVDGGETAFGFGVDRYPALAAGGGGPAARQGRDQAAHLAPAVADDAGRPAYCGGNQAKIDDHQAQVLAIKTGFDQDPVADLAGGGNGAPEVLHGLDADGNALALLAPGRLDHHPAMACEEGGEGLLVVAGHDLFRHDKSGLFDDA